MTYDSSRPDTVAPHRLSEAPSTEPITTPEIRSWVRQDTTADDTILAALVAAARQFVEEYTGRALVTQEWIAYLPAFPDDDDAPIILPGGPVATSPALVVEYRNASGVWTTLASSEYELDQGGDHEYASLWPSVSAGGWPLTPTPGDERQRGGTGWKTREQVRVTYTVGYGAASQVPEQIKQAIRLHAGWYYDHRNEPMGKVQLDALHNLLAPYRLQAY
jgi:hypothetical protein